jgi:hypothetical protein
MNTQCKTKCNPMNKEMSINQSLSKACNVKTQKISK